MDNTYGSFNGDLRPANPPGAKSCKDNDSLPVNPQQIPFTDNNLNLIQRWLVRTDDFVEWDFTDCGSLVVFHEEPKMPEVYSFSDLKEAGVLL